MTSEVARVGAVHQSSNTDALNCPGSDLHCNPEAVPRTAHQSRCCAASTGSWCALDGWPMNLRRHTPLLAAILCVLLLIVALVPERVIHCEKARVLRCFAQEPAWTAPCRRPQLAPLAPPKVCSPPSLENGIACPVHDCAHPIHRHLPPLRAFHSSHK